MVQKSNTTILEWNENESTAKLLGHIENSWTVVGVKYIALHIYKNEKKA